MDQQASKLERIIIAPSTFVIPEVEFTKPATGATMTLALPQPARREMGIMIPVTVDAEMRASSQTYRFAYKGKQYRIFQHQVIFAEA